MGRISLAVEPVSATRTEFVKPSDPRWSRLLEQTSHDVYHLAEYVERSADLEKGEPLLFVAEEGDNFFLVPIIIRPIPRWLNDGGPTLFDSTSPYGYPSPVVSSAAAVDDAFINRAITMFVEALQAREIVSCFVRLHPLLPLPPEPLERAGTLVHHGDTVSVDLKLSSEDLWRQIREDHRRGITRATRAGLTVRMDPSWEAFDGFVDVYYETMRRAGADDFYFFPRADLDAMRRALGEHIHLCVAELDGRLAAAGLFAEAGGIIQYHLSGTSNDYIAMSPVKEMFHFVMDWAKERGNQTLHLGGGVGGRSDSLFNFKAGFSPLRHPFFTWRLTTDERVYRNLVRRWEAKSGKSSADLDEFFPVYRRPGA